MIIKVHFRPNLFVIYPKRIFPKKQPRHRSDAIHDASSMFITPDRNGVSSDVSKTIVGLVHPSAMPNAIVSRFAAFVKSIKHQQHFFLSCIHFSLILPTNAVRYWNFALCSCIAFSISLCSAFLVFSIFLKF